jgi:hypothetical protein
MITECLDSNDEQPANALPIQLPSVDLALILYGKMMAVMRIWPNF